MIKAAFILLTVVMAGLAYVGITKAAKSTFADKMKLSKFRTTTLLLLAGWLSYVTVISVAGVLQKGGLPPRIPLMLILPLFTFMFWFVRSGRFAGVIAALPGVWLVYAQSFRIIVELLLHALYKEGILPKMGTFEGYNYEIVIGITALLIGYLGYTKQVLPRGILVLWNWMGLGTLAVVVFIFLSHVYMRGLYVNPEPLSIEDFGAFPYTLLAGFLMPMAVFMHVLSLMKLSKSNSKNQIPNSKG